MKIMGLIFWLFLVPFAMGVALLSRRNTNTKSFSEAIIFGYIVFLVLLETVGIPIGVLCVDSGYTLFRTVFAGCSLVIFALGVFIFVKNKHWIEYKERIGRIPNAVSKLSLESKIYSLLFILLLLGQLVMIFVFYSLDVDDFYYNSYATSAIECNVLYRRDPNTGYATSFDIRHGLAMIPILQAFISSMSGIHVLVVVHRVFPLVVIPLSYLILYKIAGELFPKSTESRLQFMFLISVFRMFGCVSILVPETFLFIRTWQGKSLAGNIIIPLIIFIFLRLFKKERPDEHSTKWLYLVLSICIFASGAMSSLAVLLCLILTGFTGLIFAISEKNAKVFTKALVSMIPGILYIAVYVVGVIFKIR